MKGSRAGAGAPEGKVENLASHASGQEIKVHFIDRTASQGAFAGHVVRVLDQRKPDIVFTPKGLDLTFPFSLKVVKGRVFFFRGRMVTVAKETSMLIPCSSPVHGETITSASLQQARLPTAPV